MSLLCRNELVDENFQRFNDAFNSSFGALRAIYRSTSLPFCPCQLFIATCVLISQLLVISFQFLDLFFVSSFVFQWRFQLFVSLVELLTHSFKLLLQFADLFIFLGNLFIFDMELLLKLLNGS